MQIKKAVEIEGTDEDDDKGMKEDEWGMEKRKIKEHDDKREMEI